MSLVAIVSDIHANSAALEVVLAEAQSSGASHLIVCGDVTGYYYNTDAVWQMLKVWNPVMCRGNHEVLFRRWLAGDDDYKASLQAKYGSSFVRADATLNSVDRKQIISLSHPVTVVIDDVRFLVAHGAPWDEDVYLYPDMNSEDLQRLESYSVDYDVILTGHTHYQMIVGDKKFQVINPGSVGQPRSGHMEDYDGYSRAEWALFDLPQRKCTLKTSMYDSRSLMAQIEEYDPGLPYLKKVLTRRVGIA